MVHWIVKVGIRVRSASAIVSMPGTSPEKLIARGWYLKEEKMNVVISHPAVQLAFLAAWGGVSLTES